MTVSSGMERRTQEDNSKKIRVKEKAGCIHGGNIRRMSYPG